MASVEILLCKELDTGLISIPKEKANIVHACGEMKEDISSMTKAEDRFNNLNSDLERIKSLDEYLNADPEWDGYTLVEKDDLNLIEDILIRRAESSAFEFTNNMHDKWDQTRKKRRNFISLLQKEREAAKKEDEDARKLLEDERIEKRKELLEQKKEENQKRREETQRLIEMGNKEFFLLKKRQNKFESTDHIRRKEFEEERERKLKELTTNYKYSIDYGELRQHEMKIKTIIEERKKGNNSRFNSSTDKHFIELIQKEREYKLMSLSTANMKIKNRLKMKQYLDEQKKYAPPRAESLSKAHRVIEQRKREANFGYYYKIDIAKKQKENQESDLSTKFFKKGKYKKKLHQSMREDINDNEENPKAEYSEIDQKKKDRVKETKNYMKDVTKEYALKKSVNDWEKYLKKAEDGDIENLGNILQEAERLEAQAQLKEELARVKKDKRIDENEDVDNLYYNSIKAKLAVLEKIKQ